MRLKATAFLLGLASLCPLVAPATVCASDQAAAATLLFPSLVFDYQRPIDGDNTNLAIINLSSEAQIVRMTIWSDLDVPVLSFNIVLSGYDVETMNTRDILFNGLLPDTGTSGGLAIDGADPFADGPSTPESDGLAPSASTRDLALACSQGSEGYPNHPTIANGVLQSIEMILRESQLSLKAHVDCDGNPAPSSFSDWFLEFDRDDVVNFYATADVVQRCDRFFPTTSEYWDETIGDANVLTGDVLWTNNRERSSEGSPAVHIESGYQGPSGGFYSRFTTELAAKSANREPLPNAWAVRYFGAGDEALSTDLRVWKGWSNSPVAPDRIDREGSITSVACNSYTVYAFDEDENVIVFNNPWCNDYCCVADCHREPNILPLTTQSVSIDKFHTPASIGWMLLVWPPSNHVGAESYQTWVGTRFSAFETFSAHTGSTPVANANCFPNQVLPQLGIGAAGKSIARP